MKTTLTMLVHGESGAGKSWFASGAPGPRLVLDAEGRAQYAPSGRKVYWDPMREEPPVNDGTWDTCIATVTEFDQMQSVYQWLRSGKHPFVSVIIDSLMEIQKRCIDKVAGTNQLTQQDWGTVLRRLEALVRSYRDLTLLTENPVACVVLVVGTVEVDGTRRPLLQGALRNTVPYYLDVVGYVFTQQVPSDDGTTMQLKRMLLTQPQPGFVAKDGTGLMEPVMEIPDPREGETALVNIVEMMRANGKAEAITTTQEAPA